MVQASQAYKREEGKEAVAQWTYVRNLHGHVVVSGGHHKETDLPTIGQKAHIGGVAIRDVHLRRAEAKKWLLVELTDNENTLTS